MPENWATAETIQAMESTQFTDSLYPGSNLVSLDESGDLALFGGADGVAGIYSISQKETVHALKCGSAVTATSWWDSRQVVATFAGAVKFFENGAEIGQLGSHAGAATSLAMHPSGQILASTGVDKSFIFYDLSNMKVASHIYTESGKYHHAIIIQALP